MSTDDQTVHRDSKDTAASGGGPVTPIASDSRRAVVSAAIGNLLEAYDFAIYGYFVVIISSLFFPASNPTASLLLTVATFGVGFVMRPIGAVVLGSLADRRGRKVALTVTILAMAGGTALIGLAPTYAAIGVWAPAIIVVARLVQGFSAGGEFGTATAFMIEHAPARRRGYVASWQQTSQVAALLLGSLLAAGLTAILTESDLESWGWRVPFLLGLVIGPVGFYIRSRTAEPEEFTRAAASVAGRTSPVRDVLGRHWRAIVVGVGITIGWTVCTYFFLVHMPTYAIRELGISSSVSFASNSAGLLLMLLLVPLAGTLSDRVGRKGLLLGGLGAVVVLTYPALALLSATPSGWSLVFVQCVFAVAIALFTGVAPAAIAEIYPARVRSTGTSIAYSFAVAIFGGFAPFIATWLIAETGDSKAPAIFVVASCVVSCLVVFALYGRGGPPRRTRTGTLKHGLVVMSRQVGRTGVTTRVDVVGG
jgi:MFS transporter, MHS family, proline/betaine transporter